MGLLSTLIVNGLHPVTSSVSHALANAVSPGIANALTGGSSGGASGGGVGAGATTVDPVTLTGQGGSIDPSYALAKAAGTGLADFAGPSLSSTTGPDDAPVAASQTATDDKPQSDPTNLEGFDVTAAPRQQLDSAVPAAVAALPSGLANFNPASPVLSPPDDPLNPLIPAAVLGGGLGIGALMGGMTEAPAAAPSMLDSLGLSPKDIIPALVLAGGLGVGAGGGGGGGAGDAGTGLATVAKNSTDLANRLGNIADAGFQGNIGGKGINTIEHQVRKAQAAIRQRYAAMGMSGSTAENDDLQAAASAGVDLQFKVGQEMASTGLTAIAALTGQSAAAYSALLNAQTAKDTSLGNALANFAAALVH